MTIAAQTPQQAAAETQRQAADPSCSVWVSASAGSGKTKVLIDRFVRLLLAGTRPQKILCLTYTQAAAAEMNARVTERLSRWAICAEETLVQELVDLCGQAQADTALCAKARQLFAAVLDCPGGLRIKTFHAFAQEILARFPLEAGIVPHFTVLEQAEADNIAAAAMADVLTAAIPAVQSAYSTLAAQFTPEQLQGLLRQLGHDEAKRQAAIAQAGGVTELIATLYQRAGFTVGQTVADLQAAACSDAVLPVSALHEVATALSGFTKQVNAPLRGQALRQWLALSGRERQQRFADYADIFLTGEGTVQAYLFPAPLKKKHPELLAVMEAEAERLLALRERCQRLARVEIMTALLLLGTAHRAAYSARKAQAAALDFDDSIWQCAALLEQAGIAPWVLWKLDGGIDHIMVDEAQDTSPMQWRILQALTAEFFAGDGARAQRAARTLFVVGDEKQSIYSFQHADPRQFHRMRDYFAAQITAAGQRFVDLRLNISFRSAPVVLQTIDTVFALPAAQAGVSTTPVVHNSSRNAVPGLVTLWPPERPTVEEKIDTWQVPQEYRFAQTPLARLAAQVAAQIQQWLDEQHPIAVREQGQERIRPVQPGDIMILVQRRKALVPALIRALKSRQVPVSGVDRLVLTDALAVQDLLALVQFALLPEDDLNLATVLRGPLLGLDEPTLEDLCYARKDSLWAALQATPAQARSVGWLQQLLASADYGGSYEFLTQILQQPCPMADSGRRALLQRLGQEVLDPVEELLNRAQQFAAQQPDTLQGFWHAVTAEAEEIKRELEQGAGEVRIMTVHAAKGLQAPLVIIPDSCRVPDTKNLPAIQWDDVTGLPHYCGGKQETRDALAEALRSAAAQRQQEEYRRLLYVALTRAETELHVYGYENKRSNKIESWHRLMQQALVPAMADSLVAGQALGRWGQGAAAIASLPTVKPAATIVPLPDWATQAAAPESFQRILSPSQLGADEAALSPIGADQRAALQRGRLVHQLLQYLPTLPVAARVAAAQHYLAQQAADGTGLAEEVLRLMAQPAVAPLFAPGSRAEVPLTGWVTMPDGQRLQLQGQLDRLAVTANEVLLVDYKTNRPPPASLAQLPAAYRRQMAAYRALLAQIYPDKPVRCFLLWTYTAHMQEIPPELLSLGAAA